jgi:hypothetical protein
LSGSGIGGTEGLGKRGFENFGKRLFSPTGTDGISNFLLNPFGKSVEKGITLEPESVKNFAKKYGITNSEALKYLTANKTHQYQDMLNMEYQQQWLQLIF